MKGRVLVCAWCSAANNGASEPDPSATMNGFDPQDGDAGLCAECGRWNVVEDAAFRRPTESELLTIRSRSDARLAEARVSEFTRSDR